MSQEKPTEQPADAGRIAFSNSIQLNPRQWLGLLLFAFVFIVAVPPVWRRMETLPVEPDYRIPQELSSDYWLFQRYADLAAEQKDVVILGDSVVWGEYVTPEGTLSHYLNEKQGKVRFANLGLSGAHQLALEGLVKYYASSITDMNVVLHCNPLWFSSKRVDLQDDSDEEFNHPRLIPQFRPSVPRYKADISQRLGVLVEQRLPFLQWASHIQRGGVPSWTIAHPYDDPLQSLKVGLAPLDHADRHEQEPWYKDKSKVNFDWIDLETSQQWKAFKEVLEILEDRGNQVIVVVGPFNEHMLTPASRDRYQKVKKTIGGYLSRAPHVVPSVLASELYGDASHPLAAGYAELARQLLAHREFRQMLDLGAD